MQAIQLNSATAAQRRIPFSLVDATDLVTPEDIVVTGVKVNLSFLGAASAPSTNDIVKVNGAAGEYYIELTQAEANTGLGIVRGWLTPTGCALTKMVAAIITENAYAAGLTAPQVADQVWDEDKTGHTAANSMGAQVITKVDDILVDTGTTLDALILAIKAKTDNLPATDAATAIVAAVFARVFSVKMGSLTFEELVALMGVTLLGKASGLSTGTPVFRNIQDTGDAVNAVADTGGNRTTVTLTPASVR